jgi:hypothetical protein
MCASFPTRCVLCQRTKASGEFCGQAWRYRNCAECWVQAHAQSATVWFTSPRRVVPCRVWRCLHAVAYLRSVRNNARTPLLFLKFNGWHRKIFIFDKIQLEKEDLEIGVKSEFRSRTGHEGLEDDQRSWFLLFLGARWGWVINATPWPFYPRERNPVLIV